MSFRDVLKNSFLHSFASSIGAKEIIIALLTTLIVSIWIFYFYRIITRNSFYSKQFNLSLVAVSLITCAIILTIQTSIVVSLGMVGALSIVRFRTAIKNPMDLAFLFWAISDGIICGAGQVLIALLLTIILTIVMVCLDKIPLSRKPQICVLEIDNNKSTSTVVEQILREYTCYFDEQTRSTKGNEINLVYEVRCNRVSDLWNALSSTSGVNSVAILKHNGEVTF